MNFEHTQKTKDLIVQVSNFIDQKIKPKEAAYTQAMNSFRESGNPWQVPEVLYELKTEAKAEGLWNFSLTGDEGYGLTNLEFAPLAEMMGVGWTSEVFNSSAPDAGNMEVLDKYGSIYQKEKWLKPLLDGQIRSAFAMTEPNVASSDATNIASTISQDGDDYVINGEKWWTSGYGRPDCEFMIFMGVSNHDAPRHQRQSQIIIPKDTPGITLQRMLTVYGSDHAPNGHAHLKFDNVRIPKENIILGEGRGFEIAQGRLGPGRIHHCMKIIGAAELALELLCKRASTRKAFGKAIAELGGNFDVIAKCRNEIEMCRLLTLKAAYMMDTLGNKEAKSEIAQPKVEVPSMAVRVIERAIQIHGGAGVSQDTPLASLYSSIRYLRIGDGPDEVHMRTIAKEELKKYLD
jgi:acyl-CoA dehydrogenase